jgi:dCMP deaminase
LFGLSGVRLRRYNNTRDEIIIITLSDDSNHGSSSYYSSPLKATTVTTKLNITSMISSSRSSELESSSRVKGLQLQQESNYPLLTTSQKRQSYLSWDDYFLMVAFLSAQRSKDPNTQVGACIVNPKKRIVGIGYNGFPCGCSDDLLPWSRIGHSPLHTKYPYVCHAEANAILNSAAATREGSTMYVDLFPCNECAKLIIQTGIREVIYLRDLYHDADSTQASRILFQLSGVAYRQYRPSMKRLVLDLRSGKSSFDSNMY